MRRIQRRRAQRTLCALLSGIALLATSTQRASSQAADSGQAAAQAVGTAFLNAVQVADWKAAVGFLDIVPFDHYRLAQIDNARRMRRPRSLTVEDLMRADSLMPRAVAEYQIKRMNQQPQRSFLEYEFGIADPDSLAALPANVVAQRWLEIHDPRWRFHTAIKNGSCPASIMDSLPRPKFHVLGTVANGNTAYLLYERDDDPVLDFDEVRSSGPRMLTLRRGIDAWWVLPRVNVSGGYASFSSSISCSKTK